MILMIINCLFSFRKFARFWRKTSVRRWNQIYRVVSLLFLPIFFFLLIFFSLFLSVCIGMLMKLFLTFRGKKKTEWELKKNLHLFSRKWSLLLPAPVHRICYLMIVRTPLSLSLSFFIQKEKKNYNN